MKQSFELIVLKYLCRTETVRQKKSVKEILGENFELFNNIVFILMLVFKI